MLGEAVDALRGNLVQDRIDLATHEVRARRRLGVHGLALAVSSNARRGRADHDYAAVHNDLGEFVARVKLTPGMQPGQVHIFHAWLATQHVGGRASDAITPSPPRVTNFAGKHGHMVNEVGWFDLSGNDRDTRVDLRKYTA